MRRLRDFWLGQADLAPIALFRIVYGAQLFNWFWQLYPNLTAFFTDEGFLPRYSLLEHFPAKSSLLMLTGDWLPVAVFWVVSLIVAVMLMIGYRTRTACVLAFITVISFQSRNPLILDGSDLVFRAVPFWLAFTSCGDRFSVDAALRRSRGDAPTGRGFALPIRVLELQVAWIYLATGIEKLAGTYWENGTAAFYALQLKHTFGRWWAESLARLEPMYRTVTWWTMVVELGFAPAAFFPVLQPWLRIGAALAAASLHFGILTLMNVGNFPVIMLSTTILFLPAAFAERVVREAGRPFRGVRTRVYFDAACSYCERTAAFLKALDAYGTVETVPLGAETAGMRGASRKRVHALDERDRKTAGLAAVATAGRGIPVLWPLALLHRLPGGDRVARVLYTPLRRFVPIECPGEDCALHAARQQPRPLVQRRETRASALGVAAFVAVSIIVFSTALPSAVAAFRPSQPFEKVLLFSALDQRWDMFSPDPARTDGWMRGPAKLEDGTTYDLFGPDTPFDVPRFADPLYSRWAKVVERMARSNNRAYRLEFGRSICRARNWHLAPGQSPLDTFRLHYTERVIGDPGRPDRLIDHSLWEHTC